MKKSTFNTLKLSIIVAIISFIAGGILSFAAEAQSEDPGNSSTTEANAKKPVPALPVTTSTPPQADEKNLPPSLWSDADENSLRGLNIQAQRQIIPTKYRLVRLDRSNLNSLLGAAPHEKSVDLTNSASEIELPLPAGGFGRFKIVESPIMEESLAAKHPEIQTFAGVGIDDKTATLRFDITPKGFHAQILSADGAIYIDPYMKGDTNLYISYDKRDLPQGDKKFECLVEDASGRAEFTGSQLSFGTGGSTFRTYRLALAATGEYTQFHGGTVNDAVIAVVITMNRVNGIYEREFSVRFVFVDNTSILYTNPLTDPYTNNNGRTMLDENQTNLDAVIGSANYDIGHVFSTGGGGVASTPSTCNTTFKARGVTGQPRPIGDPFDVDFVAHEMGHQLGANHPFNFRAGGSCTLTNVNPLTAYEPGSGSTIMGYAGICAPQNLQPNSDPYFHGVSLDEITAYINNPNGGDVCALRTVRQNSAPTVTTASGYTIPRDTPFVLTASGADADNDALTYSWEQFDLGSTSAYGPLFRSYNPTATASRTFPRLTYILNNANTPPENYPCTINGNPVTCYTGEKLPTGVDGQMNFRVTVRDGRGATGKASTVVNVSGSKFALTAPNGAGETWTEGETKQIAWLVGGGSVAPTVNIRLSTDGGNTFPITLAENTANDGSETITVPDIASSNQARVKIEAVGNIFFDISDGNFTVTGITEYAVSGRVTESGSGLAHVRMRLRSGTTFIRETATDADGNYSFGGLAAGNYELVAAKVGYAFTPPSRVLTLNADQTNQDFAAQGFARSNGRIAFASDGNAENDLEIYTINADGTDLRRLTNRAGEDSEPSFSPDGTQIVYRRGTEIYKMNADGSSPEPLTGNNNDSQPAWSPDGTQIAFVRELDGNNREIFVMTTSGAGQRRLTDNAAADRNPAWSYDGRSVYFASNRTSGGNPTGDFEIFATDVVNPMPLQLTQNAEADHDPNVSGVTDLYAWTATRNGNEEIFTLNNAFEDVNLSNNPASDSAPAWSPDGQRIAFVSTRDGDAEIFTMTTQNGAGQTAITQNSGYDFAPDWGAVATPAYRISGSVVFNSAGISGVNVRLRQNGNVVASATTDSAGRYTFERVAEGGNYTIKPDPTNFYYTPPSQTITNLSASVTLPDFVATQTTTYVWNGTTGSWSDSSKWAPGGVPGAGDRVVINSGTVSMNTAHTVRELNVGGGQLTGGSITVLGGLNFTAGQINTTITLASGSISEFDGDNSKQLISLLNNNGTINVNGPGKIFCGSLTIENNGTFNINRNGPVFDYIAGYGASFFYNNGVLSKTGGEGDAVFSDSASVNFTNRADKTINVSSGSLRFVFGSTLQAGTTISGSGRYLITSGTTAVNGQINITGNLEMTGGVLQTSANVPLNYAGSRLKWSGGTINGNFTIPAGANFNVEGDGDKTLSGLLTNNGTVNMSGAGRILAGSVTIDNYGAFKVARDGVVFGFPSGYGASFFRNYGTFEKNAGSGVLTLTDSGSVNFENFENKTVSVAAGTLRFAYPIALRTGTTFSGAGAVLIEANVSAAGQINVNSAFEIAGGTFTSSAGAVLNSSAAIRWTGGALNGTFTIPSAARLNIEGAGDKILSGAFTNNGTVNLTDAGKLYLGSVTVDNYGVFNVARNGVAFSFPASYGTSYFRNFGFFKKTSTDGGTLVVTDSGSINFDNQPGKTVDVASGTLQFAQPVTLRDGTTLVGDGRVLVTNNLSLVDALNVFNFWGLEIAGGTLQTFGNARIIGSGNRTKWTGGTITGTLTIPAGSTFDIEGSAAKILTGAFYNAGSVFWNSGDIGFGSFTFHNQDGATFSVANAAGSIVLPAGYGASFFNNAGSLVIGQPIGLFRFGSSGLTLANTATGIINIDVGGTTPGVNLDQITGSENLQLGGKLRVSLLNNYLPPNGTAFPVILHGARSGTFSNIEVVGGGGAVNFTAQYNAGSVALVSSVQTYSIGGRVTNARNQPLANISVALGGSQTAMTTTNANGDYSFANLAVGNYTVTPSGQTFTPASRTYNSLSANVTTGNFVAGIKRSPFDFDGDGKTDVSIFRPLDGSWWYLRSLDAQFNVFRFGVSSDKIVPGDYTGDGKTDIAVFRPETGTWFIQRSEDNSFFSFPFGTNGDIPAPADYDNDGKTDAAVFRPSSGTWYILNSGGSGTGIVNFGSSEDKPVPADFDGDGKADIAIFRPSDGSWWYLQSTNSQFKVYRFGVSTDKPVQGDYTGDGKADIAVFRPSTGEWFVQRSEDNSYFSFTWGLAGDIPAPGDYDGDGKADAGVFRPSNATWYMNQTTAGVGIVTFGSAGDNPVPNAFVP